MRTKLDKMEGRKVWVSGSMETLDGVVVAQAKSVIRSRTRPATRLTIHSALFIEPKWAQFLESSGVTEAMGRPMPLPSSATPPTTGTTMERSVGV